MTYEIASDLALEMLQRTGNVLAYVKRAGSVFCVHVVVNGRSQIDISSPQEWALLVAMWEVNNERARGVSTGRAHSTGRLRSA